MKKFSLYTSIVVAFLISSCNLDLGNKKANRIEISSDLTVVQKLVKDLVIGRAKNEIVPVFIQQIYHVSPQIWGNPTYDDLKKATNDKEAQKLVKEIDNALIDLDLKIINTRTTLKNQELNYIECEAVVNLNGMDAYSIKYSAQLTDNKENVYVKLLVMIPIN